jgi:WD40 repeat protein/uncharacterized caspase-like protein
MFRHLNCSQRARAASLFLIALFAVPAKTLSIQQDPKTQQPTEKQDRGLGVRPNAPDPKSEQVKREGSNKPEIVLQAGISVPQTMIGFSPDGRLLASMGMTGNSIKLWEVSSGRLLRQLESSIPTMGASTVSRPFRFSADGKLIIAMADGRIRRWEVETGRELDSTALTSRGNLLSAQLNVDGRILAGPNLDSSKVRLWDTISGRELSSITFQEDENMTGQDTFALSTDGKNVAALTQTVKGSMKGIEIKRQATVWDVTNGRKIQSIKVGSKSSTPGLVGEPEGSLSFTPDGTALAVRSEDSIKIWDLNTGRELKVISSPKLYTVRSDGLAMFANKFLFSPDRQVLSILGEGNKINLVDAVGTKLHALTGHDHGVVGMSFSGDAKLFASSGMNNEIKLWEVATGKEVRTLSGFAEPLTDLAFAPDGKSLTLAGPQAVSSWELTTGGVKRSLNLPAGYRQAGFDALMHRNSLLSRDGRLMIVGSSDEPLVKVWEIATGRETQTIPLGQGKELGNAAFTQDAKFIVLSEREKKKPQPPVDAQQNPVADVAASMEMPDITKMMEQMRKDPKKAQEQMKKVQDAVSKGDLSAGLSMMESLGMMPKKANKPANNLRLFELASGRQVQAIPLPSGFLNDFASNSFTSGSALAFSPDGRTLASATGFNGPLILRDVTTGQELRTLKSPFTLSVNSLAWSRDGKRLAAAQWGVGRNLMDTDANSQQDFSFEDMKFAIKIWDPQTGNELNSLPGHGNFVGSLSFSPDGRLLATGSFDSTIKLWDLTTGRELTTLKGHSGSITALDFTPDGRFLVSGGEDGSARLWQTETGTLVATMVSLNKGNDWLVVTPDGLFDGSPGGWNQILWRFTPGLYDVEPVEIFFNEYFRPGLLPDILAGRKLSAAVDIAQKDRRQPKVTLALAEAQNSREDIPSRTLKVRINVTEAPAGAQDLRLFRNGSLVKVWRGDLLAGQQSTSLETTISIVAGENRLTAYAFNRDNVKSSDASLLLKGADSLKRPATLHLLVVGLNQYANSAYNLKYAVADANAFGEELKRQQEKLRRFQHIEVISLLDGEATKANLLSALNRLTGDRAPLSVGTPSGIEKIKPAEPEDAVIVYFAGHGTAQDQRFYLIPHDLGYEGTRTEISQLGLQTILSHSISDLELEKAFVGMDAGLILMVIDACNSGQALEAEEKRRGPMNSKGLAQLAYEKGMYILTAAQSYQAALEAEQLGHGYLTFALVEEGLRSAAADNQPRDSQVILREWLDYATERVPRMQEAKMRETRGVGLGVAFVEGEQKVVDIDKRSVQRPRVFYRREQETEPFIVTRP